MRLTESQKKEVCEILRNLKDQLGDREITAENVAAVMLEFCENLDPESAGELCGRIREGAEKFYSLCADGRVRTEPDFAEKMLEEITEQMDDAQRKGFYLQSLDAFDKYRASAEETAARASLPTDELRDMLADRIREFSGTLVSGMRDSVSASRSGYAAGKEQRSAAGAGETDAQEAVLPAQKEFLEEALLYAAAEYIAGISGILPREFGAYPELLGICAASQRTLLWYCEIYEEEEDREETAQAVRNVLCAAAGAALLLGAAVVGAAAESVLVTMESSALGLILFTLSSVTIACMCVVGGALLLYSFFAVADAYEEAFGEREETAEAESVDRPAETSRGSRVFRTRAGEMDEETVAFNCTV